MFKKIIHTWVIRYLTYFARKVMRHNDHAIIIGITGSSGKTSTRLAVSRILSTRGIVKQSIHANSPVGIALNILGLTPSTYSLLDWLRLIILAPIQARRHREYFDYYVVEYGIDGPDEPDDMATLLKIVKPNIAVVLGASLAHTKSFDKLVKDTLPKRRRDKLVSLIAREKMLLAKSLSKRGVAILNIDQAEIAKNKGEIKSRIMTIGKSRSADLMIIDSKHLRYNSHVYELTMSQIFPDSYSYTFAASLAVGASMGIPLSTSINAMKDYESPPGRLRIFKGIRQSTIIDSSYNASPSSMQDCLKYLESIAKRKYKLAVIGDMNEQGSNTKFAHKDLSVWIRQYADEAILFGPNTNRFTLPLLQKHGYPCRHFETMSDLNGYLTTHLQKDSFVLVKASQNGMYLERAVQVLLVDREDVKRLARRGPFWDQLRRVSP